VHRRPRKAELDLRFVERALSLISEASSARVLSWKQVLFSAVDALMNKCHTAFPSSTATDVFCDRNEEIIGIFDREFIDIRENIAH